MRIPQSLGYLVKINTERSRAEVVLPPLADYVKCRALNWDVADYKKRLPDYKKKNGIK